MEVTVPSLGLGSLADTGLAPISLLTWPLPVAAPRPVAPVGRAGKGRSAGAAKAGPAGPAPEWIHCLIGASASGSFFAACGAHSGFRKSEATLFCVDCAAATAPAPARAACQHCAPLHAGHRVLQVRRYVYCDVVRAADIAPFVDVGGVQSYTINQAKVVFINHRPQSKVLAPGAPDSCTICCRSLREGATFCSLACKAEALAREGRLARAPSGAPGAPLAAAAAPVPLPALALPPALALGPACCGGEPMLLDSIGSAAFGPASDDSSDCAYVAGAPTPPAPLLAHMARRHTHTGAYVPGDTLAPLPRSLSGADTGADAGSGSGSGSGSATASPATNRRASIGAAPPSWLAKRFSDSSCQSFLFEWHAGHTARRKQAVPRRSPLV